MQEPALLELRGIGKQFAGVVALDGVNLTVRAREIHALLGENGAGKSTLIKVITGVHAADSGTILLGRAAIAPANPTAAEQAGISTVYQEVNLIPTLSVTENLLLGRQPGALGLIDWRAVARRAREVLARVELDCDPDAELGELSVAQQQMVAIARALDLKARLLVLDEPTASLDEKEVANLFRMLRRLREDGLGIILVTHFLDQVYALCDRATVLRNGRLAGEFAVRDLPRSELVATMLGRDLAELGESAAAPATVRPQARVVLAAQGLARRGMLHPLDLEVRRGEVLGLAGLLGSGRTEVARLLFGIDRRDAGAIRVGGQAAQLRTPRDAVALGLAFCSENRKEEGILPNLSVRENLLVALQAKRGGWKALARSEQETLCAHYIAALQIKTANAEVPIRNLSGGNQQKVLLARWLVVQPELIILDEPTRGIDIGAKAEIEKLVGKLREDGIAVVFISSEIDELVRNSTRAIVLRERRGCGEIAGSALTPSRLIHAMAGETTGGKESRP